MKNSILLFLLFYLPTSLFAQETDDWEFSTKSSCGRLHNRSSNARLLEENHHPSEDLISWMRKYDLKHYDFNIELDNNSKFIKVEVSFNATATTDLELFRIQFHQEMKISNLKLNDSDYSNYSHVNNELSLSGLNIKDGDDFKISVSYEGTATEGVFHETSDSGKSVTYTVTEPFYAYYWFPCKQLLEDKIDSVDYHFTTNSGLKVGSNGVLISTEDIGSDKVKIHWKNSHPMTYYLFSFSVSDYYEYNLYAKPKALNGDSVLIQNYLVNDANHKNQAYRLSVSQEALEELSDLFGLYPFADEKYGHTYWIKAPWGGMEHQTMSAVGSFRASLLVHELAHQWFACDVTSTDWQGIWLHEGFASYAEYLFLEYYNTDYLSIWIENWARSAKNDAINSIFIPEASKNIDAFIFNGNITYAKGPLAVHLLRYWIGDDALFFNGLKKYLNQYSGKNASISDFQKVMEESSGKDLNLFFEQWIYGTGYPSYKADYSIIDGNKIKLSLSQSQIGTDKFFNFPKIELGVKLKNKQDLQMINIEQSLKTQDYEFSFDEEVDSLVLDPNAWILKTVEYKQTFVDSSPLQVLSKKPKFLIQAYPNPAQDFVYISGCKAGTAIYLLDLNGKRIKQKIASSSLEKLSLEHIPTGFYLLEIENTRFKIQVR